jgi:Uma2 family endonuclease
MRNGKEFRHQTGKRQGVVFFEPLARRVTNRTALIKMPANRTFPTMGATHMALPKKEIAFTPEEYLAFERAAETKHEYLDGQIYDMAGASPPHNRIAFNTTVAIGAQLLGTTCFGYTSDQKIRTDPMDLFSYPDITIVCGEPVYHDDHQDVILNPRVIIEVLSPGTEAYDRGEKFARYQNTKSLTDYILIAQDRPSIEHYARQKGTRKWVFTIETEMSAEIVIASINSKLKLAAVYDRVTFPPKRAALYAVHPQPDPSPQPKRRKKP